MNSADTIRHSNIEVHNWEAAIYDSIHLEIFGSFQQRMIIRDLDLIASVIPTDSGIRVVDIGCGTGNLTLKYVNRRYRVKAIDISPEMIAMLQSKIDRMDVSSVELVVGDAEDGSCDGRSMS